MDRPDNDNIYFTIEELTGGLSTEQYKQLRELQRQFKPFSIEAFNDGAAVYTRDGRPVRILCTDRKGEGADAMADRQMPVVALVPHKTRNDYEHLIRYTADGHCSIDYRFNMDDDLDLFVAPSP